eukprot:16446817-Heterocapsa_arctica.AAC.1
MHMQLTAHHLEQLDGGLVMARLIDEARRKGWALAGCDCHEGRSGCPDRPRAAGVEDWGRISAQSTTPQITAAPADASAVPHDNGSSIRGLAARLAASPPIQAILRGVRSQELWLQEAAEDMAVRRPSCIQQGPDSTL